MVKRDRLAAEAGPIRVGRAVAKAVDRVKVDRVKVDRVKVDRVGVGRATVDSGPVAAIAARRGPVSHALTNSNRRSRSASRLPTV
jgi:hypothetical protein